MSNAFATQEIVFDNNNRASMVTVPVGADALATLQALNIPRPDALIVFLGGAGGFDQLDQERQARLFQLISRGVARAAALIGAVIIDGGTESGIMAMLGKGIADRGRQVPLIGVAPASKVTYPGGTVDANLVDAAPLEPNHSHFVLVQTDNWGGESPTIAALAQELSRTVPVVTILVNGGEISKRDLLNSVRSGLPIIIFEGSGRLADEVATLWKSKQASLKQQAPFILDPVMAEIIADGKIILFSIERTPEELVQTISQRLGNLTLQMAWSRFALYDHNAVIYQKEFKKSQWRILVLGVAATFFALVLTQFQALLHNFEWTVPNPLAFLNNPLIDWSKKFTLYDILRLPMIALPIIAAVWKSLYNRFNPGNKYTLMRAAAERVKSELFRYRTRAGIYSDARLKEAKVTRDSLLQQRVETITRELMQTEVKDAPKHPYEGPLPPKMTGAEASDDGFSPLTADRYDEIRLGDQITFHRLKVSRLGADLKRFQRFSYLVGGLGSFLAAIGLELWIAMTAALVAAITTYLQYTQTEFTLTHNNQTLTDLQNLRAWWRASSLTERADPEKFSGLVETTEKILGDENASWVRQMGDALAQLRAEQAKKDESK